MSSIATKRLTKELKELLDPEKGPPIGIKVVNTDDLKTWVLTIEVLGESVYEGEIFALRFTFTDRYPMESPEVVFVVNEQYQAPLHPHVYSNGHICASILGNEWSPVLNTASVCITLQSMLASCKKKERRVKTRNLRTDPADLSEKIGPWITTDMFETHLCLPSKRAFITTCLNDQAG